MRYGSIDANLERRTGTNAWVEMTIKEGKNREVAPYPRASRLEVSRLIRTRYGPFTLGGAPAGAVEEVKQDQLVEFLKELGKAKPQETAANPVVPGTALRKHWRIGAAQAGGKSCSQAAPGPCSGAQGAAGCQSCGSRLPEPRPARKKVDRTGWAKARPPAKPARPAKPRSPR